MAANDTEDLMNAILDSRLPATALLKRLAENACAASGTHERLMKRRREQLCIDTAIRASFGNLIRDLDVVNEDGAAVALSIIHPFALLEVLCESSFWFLRLLHACIMRAQDRRMLFFVIPGRGDSWK